MNGWNNEALIGFLSLLNVGCMLTSESEDHLRDASTEKGSSSKF